jgi:hypothetical protein
MLSNRAHTTPRLAIDWFFLGVLVISATTAVSAEEHATAGGLAEQPRISADGTWLSLQGTALPEKLSTPIAASRYRLLELDRAQLGQSLADAPQVTNASPAFASTWATSVVYLPMPDGSFQAFEVQESPILSPELQAQFLEIRTFRARGLDDPTATGRLDLTPAGFHGYVISEVGTALINPLDAPSDLYLSYWKRDVPKEPFECLVEESDAAGRDEHMAELFANLSSPNNPSGDQLRTYRLAVSATGEYTRWAAPAGCTVGGATWPDCGVDAAVAQITTTVNRITGIYEREVAISFTLVATNVYDDPATDPFTGNDVGAMLGENQADLDSQVGGASYDFGHIFSQGGSGGVANQGVCQTGSKARGATSLANPSGDVFDVDFVSHEMGHQLSGSHTWNGNIGSCSGTSQYVQSSAFEPGSGSTIMAYAGICGVQDNQDVQANSDPYFHTRSFDQITSYRDGTGACGTLTTTGNNVPFVDAGSDYTIPRDTPFVLTASGSDDDLGDALTYNWEQYDAGPPRGLPQSTNPTGPLFRSRLATMSPSRTLPRLGDLLSGAATPWEVLPTVDRTLTFRATVRDNRAGGGGVDWDDMTVTVSGDPFFVDTPENLECGASETLTWNVGGGAVAPNVRIQGSDDDGANFSTLVASTENDGAENISVPRNLTADGRVRLQAINNIFFDVSGRFSVVDTLDPSLNAPANLRGAECTSPAGASPALGTPTVSDLCDVVPAVSNDGSPPYPIGSSSVTWTAVDASGNSTSAVQLVEVVDTTAPAISAPADVVAECSSPAGTPVGLGTAIATDTCDLDPTVMNNAPALFPLGDTSVTWTGTDDQGNQNSAAQLVTVQDTVPPEIEVTVAPTVLWPPNHKLSTISATVVATDICDAAPVVRLISITSNESDNGLGDGNTVGDIQEADLGADDRDFRLRAERSGLGGGRVYTILYEAEDASGNVNRATATVAVPNNR